MTGVKNWTVKCKSLKDEPALIKMGYYINSTSHPNHANTKITKLLNNSERFIRNTLNSFNNKRMSELATPSKGRPISSPGHDWIFSLPPEIRPTQEQWREISKDIFKEFAKYLTPTITAKAFKEHCAITLHEEDGKNPHIHILTSNVILNEVQRDIKRKAAISGLKNAFKHSVLKHTGISNKQYIPLGNRLKTPQNKNSDPIEEFLELSNEEQAEISQTMNKFRHRNDRRNENPEEMRIEKAHRKGGLRL